MDMPLTILSVASFVALLIVAGKLYRQWAGKKALRNKKLRLEESAHAALLKADLPEAEYIKCVKSIEDAMNMKDNVIDSVELLGAYARMLHACSPFDIQFAAVNMKYAQLNGEAQSLSIPMLTVEHVRAYCDVAYHVEDAEDYSTTLLNAPSARMGVYAMEHLEDAPIMHTVVTERGVKDFETLKQVVAEIKASPSRALSEGAL